MRLLQIGHNALHPTRNRTWQFGYCFQTVLAGLIGGIIGLLMGLTALVAFLGSKAVSEAGEPGMLLIKVLIVGTFIILSVILFIWEFDRKGEDID